MVVLDVLRACVVKVRTLLETEAASPRGLLFSNAAPNGLLRGY